MHTADPSVRLQRMNARLAARRRTDRLFGLDGLAAVAFSALILAYSPCIAHGFPLHLGAEQQKLAVDSGYWPLFRYDPRQAGEGKNPLRLDSSPPKVDLGKFMANETRFGILRNIAPGRADELLAQAQDQVRRHYALYEKLAAPAPSPSAAQPTS